MTRRSTRPPSTWVRRITRRKSTKASGPSSVPDKVKVIAGPELAAKAGNRRAVNTVMLGAISRFIPEISPEDWKKVLSEVLPEKNVQANLKAFDLGRAA